MGAWTRWGPTSYGAAMNMQELIKKRLVHSYSELYDNHLWGQLPVSKENGLVFSKAYYIRWFEHCLTPTEISELHEQLVREVDELYASRTYDSMSSRKCKI
jgi:hypothetical protein